MSGFKLTIRGAQEGVREYGCPEHGPFDLTVDLSTSSQPRPCPTCGSLSERTLNANIHTRIDHLSFVRGKSAEKPTPLAMDTRPLAEGMPLKEWKARRRKLWRDHDRSVAKQKGAF